MSRNKKKKKEKFNVLPKSTGLSLVVIILLMVEAFFVLLMSVLDILPAKYAIIVLAVLFLMDFLVFKLMKTPKRVTNKRLVGAIIGVAMLNILVIGCNYLFNTYDTFQKISEYKAQWEDYYVVADADSAYQKAEDIKGKTVYVIKAESKMYNEAKERLITKADVEYSNVADAATLCEKLTDKNESANTDVIFLSRTNFELYCENHENYEEGTRIIDTITVEVKTDDFADRINVTEDPFIMYITGNDQYGKLEGVSRSDVNMVMAVHPVNREILLVSIPRDSYVMLHSYGAYDKLTHAGIYGVDETVATVEDWLDIDINYYFRVNFSMLVRIVDAVGGVTVDVPKAFSSTYWDYSYKEGENHLKGKAALAFVRERKNLDGMDMERGKNQQRLLSALLKKVTQSEVILTKYTKILDSVEGYMQTNMSNKDISSLVKMQINDMRGWNIKSISIDGGTGMQTTYSMGSTKLSTVIPYEDSVNEAKEAIHAILYPAENDKAAEDAKQEIDEEAVELP